MCFYIEKIIMASLISAASVYSIKKYESCGVYGRLTNKIAFLIGVLAYFCVRYVEVVNLSTLEGVVKSLALIACLFLLIVASYMDQKDGAFHLMVLIKASVLIVAAFIFSYRSNFQVLADSVNLFVFITIFLAVVSLMGMGWGDFLIIMICQFVFFILCPESYDMAICTMMLIAICSFVIRRLSKCVKKIRGVYPFAFDLSVGTALAIMIYA